MGFLWCCLFSLWIFGACALFSFVVVWGIEASIKYRNKKLISEIKKQRAELQAAAALFAICYQLN